MQSVTTQDVVRGEDVGTPARLQAARVSDIGRQQPRRAQASFTILYLQGVKLSSLARTCTPRALIETISQ
nr:MAG TPA: hypothetical protein [Caudoviricetes sp.]